jgi:hypothetical protein
VEFKLRLEEDDQFLTFDGRIVRCTALTVDGQELAGNRRMVFVKNTLPEKAVRDLRKGDELHVLGIPRIDLAVVSWRARNAAERPEALHWNLPYEIIVVGVYQDESALLRPAWPTRFASLTEAFVLQKIRAGLRSLSRRQ